MAHTRSPSLPASGSNAGPQTVNTRLEDDWVKLDKSQEFQGTLSFSNAGSPTINISGKTLVVPKELLPEGPAHDKVKLYQVKFIGKMEREIVIGLK